MKLEGLELIKDYRAHRERYLPMVDHTEEVPQRNEYGDVNIGWNTGLLESNRPYFVECWATEGITVLTIFVSTKGIEQKTPDELTRWFLDIGLFSFTNGGYHTAQTVTCTNPEGEEFFSINIAVGVEDEPAIIDGAPVLPWQILYDYNRTSNSFRDGALKTTGTEIDKTMPPISRFGGGNRAAKKQSITEKLKGFFEKLFG